MKNNTTLFNKILKDNFKNNIITTKEDEIFYLGVLPFIYEQWTKNKQKSLVILELENQIKYYNENWFKDFVDENIFNKLKTKTDHENKIVELIDENGETFLTITTLFKAEAILKDSKDFSIVLYNRIPKDVTKSKQEKYNKLITETLKLKVINFLFTDNEVKKNLIFKNIKTQFITTNQIEAKINSEWKIWDQILIEQEQETEKELLSPEYVFGFAREWMHLTKRLSPYDDYVFYNPNYQK